ncbi:arginyl-tRNA synthetase [Plectosphaerella cucumerina]|uniref:arginine--tRNA ligase n=1 Tax=Plectosphaerella cucumerina TaxID=40658 RepID=A0A8K0WYB4_9PEZI|nr:arginyl-tRNA synthetase [Plectosphaerella cucumerina]
MATDTLNGLESLLGGLNVSGLAPVAASTDVLHNPIDIYRSQLADTIIGLVHSDPQVALDAIQLSNEVDNGDLVITLPRLRLQKTADELEEIGNELTQQVSQSPLFTVPILDGALLRIFLSQKILPSLLLPYISDRGAAYGASSSLGLHDASAPKSGTGKLLIEFSSPNIAKKFTGAHLRSTLLGAHIAALHERLGWEVTRVNYLGDWGKHIGLLAVGWQRSGSEEAFAADPFRHLLDLYTEVDELLKPELEARKKIREEKGDPEVIEARVAEHDAKGLNAEKDAWCKRLEDGDPDAVALWRRFKDFSIEQYVQLYSRLGVTFDEYAGESRVSAASIAKVEEALREKGVYEEDHGAWVIDFKKHGAIKGLGKGVLRDRTGLTSYLLRDIAAVLDREEAHKFEKMIYVVSADQDTHFKRVNKALQLMGREDLAAASQYVNFGHVQELEFPDGRHAALLSDFLDHTRTVASALLETDVERAARFDDPVAVVDQVGASALMVHVLYGKKQGQLSLDLTEAATFDANTGPYLQYWHARLCSFLRTSAGPAVPDYSAVKSENYGDLFRLLAQYPDAARAALRNMEPGPLMTYLFRLLNELSGLLPEDEDWPDASASDALVYAAARQVVENGMNALGIPICSRI